MDHSVLKPIGEVNEYTADILNGWNNLALNPVDQQIVAASSGDYVRKVEDVAGHKDHGSIQLYKLNNETIKLPESAGEGPYKR